MKMMMLAAVAALTFASAAIAAPPNCVKGKLCGNTCIAKDKVCHITPPKVPTCTTGKLCGNTCIAKTATCHKP